MSTAAPSLSIILLMYNEAPSILDVLEETQQMLCAQPLDGEIIVVDDGSTDDGAAIARRFAAEHPFTRVISHLQNQGMGAGMATGIAAATGSHLIFNAADGQIPASQIARMLPLLQHADIVLTTWENGRESPFRNFLSRAFRIYLRRVAGLHAALEGLYLFPTAAAKRLAPQIRANSFLYSFILIQKGLDEGLSMASTRIRCFQRRAGKSKTLRLSTIATVFSEGVRFRVAEEFGKKATHR